MRVSYVLELFADDLSGFEKYEKIVNFVLKCVINLKIRNTGRNFTKVSKTLYVFQPLKNAQLSRIFYPTFKTRQVLVKIAWRGFLMLINLSPIFCCKSEHLFVSH